MNRLTNAAYSDGSVESYLYDSAGNRCSRITSAPTKRVDNREPSLPTNLVSLDLTPSHLSLAWNRAFDTGGSGLAGYDIFLNGTIIASTTGTNFLLKGLLPNTQYCLSVTAFDRSTNVSARAIPLCITTPMLERPFLIPLGFDDGTFRVRITNGSLGPYDVLTSSNLMNWQTWTNLFLPLESSLFVDPVSAEFSRRFYQLRWSTNSP